MCNASTGELQRGSVASKPGLLGQLQGSKSPCLKKNEGKSVCEPTWGTTPEVLRFSSGFHMHMHICSHVYTIILLAPEISIPIQLE